MDCNRMCFLRDLGQMAIRRGVSGEVEVRTSDVASSIEINGTSLARTTSLGPILVPLFKEV